MKTFIFRPKEKIQLFLKSLFLVCIISAPIVLAAQPSYTFSYSTGNTYTPLTTGSDIELFTDGSTNVMDEGLSASISIGFPFSYNAKSYNNFKVNANGFVTLDSLLIWDAYQYNFLDRLETEPKFVIAALWDDLMINTGGNIRYELTGEAGSRILKIEFNNLGFFPVGGAVLIYQVWLYEGTNVIEFRYGGNTLAMGDDWLNDCNGISIGLNDDRVKSYISITPGPEPSYSFTVANNTIWSHQYITPGLTYTFTPVIRWLGVTNNNWLTKTNWEFDSIPSTVDNALIPAGKDYYPIINGSGANCKDLTVESGGNMTVTGGGELTVTGDLFSNGTLTISSSSETNSGSFIVKGTSSGDITYQRYLTGGTSWHMVASPVEEQDIWSWATAAGNDIAQDPGFTKRAITTYNEGTDDWDAYPTSGFVADFAAGTGYSTLRATDGTVSFFGTLNTNDISGISLSRGGQGWNLLGNPYTSAIGATSSATSSDYLLSTSNVANLDDSYAGLYLWDPTSGSSGEYVIINNSGGTPTATLDEDYIQAGQGFFVRAKDIDSRTFDITKAMQMHQTTIPFKSGNKSWPTINLTAISGNSKSSTQISFNYEMTTGLDVTYDAGMFKNNPDFALYSRLIADNGVDFAIQCLPEDYETLVIPVGFDAPIGTEVTFSAELFNLPEECQPYLEDRIADKFIPLFKSGSSYSVVANEKYRSFEALFLHTSNSFVTQSEQEEMNEPFKIIANPKDGFIRVMSTDNQSSLLKVYDISGRIVAVKEINYGNNNLIFISGNPGIYVIRINNEKHNFSQKLFWYK